MPWRPGPGARTSAASPPGGSTQSLHTALSAVAKPGETVLWWPRTPIRREYASAIFAGLDLQPVPVTVDRDWDLEHGVTATALAQAFDAQPHAKAALVVSPTYFGVTSDIAALAEGLPPSRTDR